MHRLLDQEERKSFGSFEGDGPQAEEDVKKNHSSSSEEEVKWSLLPPVAGSKRERQLSLKSPLVIKKKKLNEGSEDGPKVSQSMSLDCSLAQARLI